MITKKVSSDVYAEIQLLDNQISSLYKKIEEVREQRRAFLNDFILKNYGFASGDIVTYTYEGKNYRGEVYSASVSTSKKGVYLDEIVVYLVNKKGKKTSTARHLYYIENISDFKVVEKGIRHLDYEEANNRII